MYWRRKASFSMPVKLTASFSCQVTMERHHLVAAAVRQNLVERSRLRTGVQGRGLLTRRPLACFERSRRSVR